MDSTIRGGLYLERYSGINRSEVIGPAGVGSFGWVSDTKIGAFVHIGARSAVGGFEHPLDRVTTSSFQWGQNSALLALDSGSLAEIHPMNVKPANPTTIIESDVWIGANVIVLAGVKLAVGSVVGAGSVLTRDTQPYGVYVGNPARLIRHRFEPDVCEKLLAAEWWNLPVEFLITLDLTDPLGTAAACMSYRESSRDPN